MTEEEIDLLSLFSPLSVGFSFLLLLLFPCHSPFSLNETKTEVKALVKRPLPALSQKI